MWDQDCREEKQDCLLQGCTDITRGTGGGQATALHRMSRSWGPALGRRQPRRSLWRWLQAARATAWPRELATPHIKSGAAGVRWLCRDPKGFRILHPALCLFGLMGRTLAQPGVARCQELLHGLWMSQTTWPIHLVIPQSERSTIHNFYGLASKQLQALCVR